MAKLTMLSFGGGQDSTAILYKYIHDAKFRAAYAPEDFIVIMSDTGDEHASTYKHVNFIKQLCNDHAIPFVFITEDMGYHGKWGNLRSQMRRTNTIFSKAFPKSCTDRLKIVPIYNYLEDHLHAAYDAVVSNGRKKGYKEFAAAYGQIDVLIGFARGEEKRLNDPAKANMLPKWQQASINKVYPLVDLGMDRQDCQDYISCLGYIVPTPSNCVLCPWMSEIELLYLYRFHRSDYEEWVVLEQNKFDANTHMEEKNLGVWGSRAGLPEWLKVAIKKYGHMSDTELQEYKMSHGHCVASKY